MKQYKIKVITFLMCLVCLSLTVLLPSCKREKDKFGLSIDVSNCEGELIDATIKIIFQDGSEKVFDYKKANIQIDVPQNSQVKIIVTDQMGSSELAEYRASDNGYTSFNIEMCYGFKNTFYSDLIETSGVAFGTSFKTDNNYSYTYNSTNNSTYIRVPIQKLSTNPTFPWQTGFCEIKLKDLTIDNLFEVNTNEILLSSDTTKSYCVYGFYSTDSVAYPHRFYISNNKSKLSINKSKQKDGNTSEISIYGDALEYNFNAINFPDYSLFAQYRAGSSIQMSKKK